MLHPRFGLISFLYLTSVVLSCLTVSFLAAQPASRSQRQVVGELATGLLNTGTSFNSLYDGQRPIDSYLNYPGQYAEQTNSNGPYGDPYLGKMNMPGMDYSNYGQKNIANYLPGMDGMSADRGTWKGFGLGKNARGYPINSASQHGLKY